jgi:serine protease Do
MKNLGYVLLLAAVAVGGGFAAIKGEKWLESNQVPLLNFGGKGQTVSDAKLIATENAPVQPVQYSGSTASPPDFRLAAKKVTPSVVSIDRFEQVPDFFGSQGVRETGSGSGVILSSDGTIVTNNHVVTNSQTGDVIPRVRVRLNDKRSFDAKVLGTDPRSDLAVIKITAPNLVPIEIGDSTQLEVGQWVLAIGNPLGFDNTVSAGVVSSLKRDLPVGASGLVNAIQTDAAINPGNSGGALTDANGRLVGVNSAIASGTGMSVGIGFAIPIDRVKQVVQDIVTLGYARYAGLGVSYPPGPVLMNPRNRQFIAERTGSENVPNQGIVVQETSGAAAQAGLKAFDILLEIDSTPIEGSFTLNKVLTPKKPGDKVKIKYWSAGTTKTVELALQEIKPLKNP